MHIGRIDHTIQTPFSDFCDTPQGCVAAFQRWLAATHEVTRQLVMLSGGFV